MIPKRIFATFSTYRLFAFILTISLLTNVFSLAAQTRRKAVAKKKATPVAAQTATAQTDENPEPNALAEADESRRMAAAFESGELPAALPMPDGSAEERAAALAAMVAAGDGNSVAALLTALKAAGYGVRRSGNEVDYEQSAWQGIALDDWLVAAVAKLYGDNFGVGFGRFAASLSRIAPGLPPETSAETLAADLRRASASDNEAVRFWANFIIELGRQNKSEFDLRSDEDVKRARLDAVQIVLILARLGADANALARKLGPRRASAVDDAGNRYARTFFVNASFGGVSPALKNAFAPETARSAADAPLPCSLGELESVVLDYNATATTAVFGELLGHFENKEVISQAPGQLVGAANAALIMMKLIATYAALDSEIALEGGTLTRTKTTIEGERRALSAKVKIDTRKWQVINCIRPALNLGGLDFSLPGSGAFAGTRVDWRLAEGGLTQEQIRKIKNGEATGSDAIVYLDTQREARADDKGKYYNYTDDAGVSRIDAVGMPQKKDLTRENVRPVIKRMAVDLNIQVKTMKLKTAVAAAGTAGDLAGNALAIWSGDIPGAITGTLAETIYRAPAGSSKTHYFPVKDWIACDGRWRGTVTYSRILFNNSSTERTIDGKAKRLWLNTDRDFYAVKVDLEPGAEANRFRATARVTYDRKTYEFYRLDSLADCKSRNPPYSNVSTRLQLTSADVGLALADEAATFSINADKAFLSIWIPSVKGTHEVFSSFTHSGGCTPKPAKSSNEKIETTIDGGNIGAVDLPYDPKNPNVLRGSRVVPGQKGQKMILSWDLSRCR